MEHLNKFETNLLVIENDKETRRVFKRFFEMSGYRVTAVADEQEAATACSQSDSHNLVLLNTNLPPPESFVAAYKMRRLPELHAMPMIFISVHEHSIASMSNPDVDDFTVGYITEISSIEELERLSKCLLKFRRNKSL